MLKDTSASINDIIASSATPTTEVWKLIHEIYKAEVNASVLNCEIVYGTFRKQLTNAKKDIDKSQRIVTDIFFELKLIEKSKWVDDSNTAKLCCRLNELQELFGSRHLTLGEKLETRADRCSEMLENQLNVINEKRKDVDKVVSISLTTAAIGFAGFAAAIGASAKSMLSENLKSKNFLRLSGSGLVIATLVQLAEYLDYNNSYNGIIHDLTELNESLAKLLWAVDDFSVELADVVEAIKKYSVATRENRYQASNFPKGEAFLSKISEMISRTKELQIILIRMELRITYDLDFVEAGKEELPERYITKKRPIKK